MFRTLTAKKKIPVQRYLRKGTCHLWRAPTYNLKEDEMWLEEWRVKEGTNIIYFSSEPHQDEIRKKIEDRESEENQRKELEAKRVKEELEKRNKKLIRRAKLDTERTVIHNAAETLLNNYSVRGIQRIRIPRNCCLPDEDWNDDRTHVTEKRPQLDCTGRGDCTRRRKYHIYITILIPNDPDFHVSQFETILGQEWERGDWELGFKVTEIPDDNYKDAGGVVKSGLFTVKKGTNKYGDYTRKWYL